MYALMMGASAVNQSGVHAELDISVIEQAKDVYWSTIYEMIDYLKIPDVISDDGKMRVED